MRNNKAAGFSSHSSQNWHDSVKYNLPSIHHWPQGVTLTLWWLMGLLHLHHYIATVTKPCYTSIIIRQLVFQAFQPKLCKKEQNSIALQSMIGLRAPDCLVRIWMTICVLVCSKVSTCVIIRRLIFGAIHLKTGMIV